MNPHRDMSTQAAVLILVMDTCMRIVQMVCFGKLLIKIVIKTQSGEAST